MAALVALARLWRPRHLLGIEETQPLLKGRLHPAYGRLARLQLRGPLEELVAPGEGDGRPWRVMEVMEGHALWRVMEVTEAIEGRGG